MAESALLRPQWVFLPVSSVPEDCLSLAPLLPCRRRPPPSRYAHIAKPLTRLTGNRLAHVLPSPDAAQWAAFGYLKERLTSTPILALPRRVGLFILDTDACAVHVGCTLMQQKPDEIILPVGYYSRVLVPAEKIYWTTDRECQAVVWACFLIRPYLEGQEFLIRTRGFSI